jgi:hypothetical protein
MAAGIILFVGWTVAHLHAQELRDEKSVFDRADLAVLNRIIARFDFEEAEREPYELPIHFYRVLSVMPGPDHLPNPPGFPTFGGMRLVREHATSGHWSFRFDLDGASMAARIPTGVCPVLPDTDYLITTQVRTEGLTHARVRLRAWLHDETGGVIAASIAESPLVISNGAWEELAVVIRGQHLSGADLIVELQVLQPAEYDVATQSEVLPAYKDVRGRVWFDDVVIRNRPRISMTSPNPAHVFCADETPTLIVDVHDVTREHVRADLTISDMDDNEIWSTTISTLPNTKPQHITPPLPAFGWYRADLCISDAEAVIADRSLTFVLLPDPSGAAHHIDGFGVVLEETAIESPDDTMSLLRRLGVRDVLAPIPAENVLHNAAPLADRLVSSLHDTTLSLPSVPLSLAREFGVDTSDVFAFFAAESDAWSRAWAPTVVELGLDITHWQIGNASFGTDYPADSQLDAVRAALDDSIPNLNIVIPRDVEAPFDDRAGDIEPHILIPSAMRAEDIAAALNEWPSTFRRIVTIELPDADRFDTRSRLGDLARRALHIWRTEPAVMRIAAPWWRDGDNELHTAATFPVWNRLAHHLEGRRFLGVLPTPEGVHAWILSAGPTGEAALVIWDDQLNRTTPAELTVRLSDRNATVFDLFGNTTTLPITGGVHHLEAHAMPTFIEGINAELVLFRALFAINNPFIPAESRIHERAIRVSNPWPFTITGNIMLRDTAGMEIRPRQQAFTLGPGEEASLPIEVLVERSIFAGPKKLDTIVTVSADREHRLNIPASMEVGLERIECQTTWRLATNLDTGHRDVVISAYITNHDDKPVNLDVFIATPSSGRRHQLVAGLAPGATTLRTFRIENGAQMLSGRRVLVGINERDGVARLNLALDLPPLDSTATVSAEELNAP